MTESASAEVESGPIVATAGTYYRRARYIMVLLILGFAAYFAYDGWKGWPAVNQEIEVVTKQLNELKNRVVRSEQEEKDLAALYEKQKALGSPHSDTDIMFQKVLAIGLPILAIGYTIFFVRRSRGQVKLENDTLSAPGHPEIQLSEITSIDNKLWDKKGIADISYKTASSSGVLRLDGFIYEQGPIDQIYEILAKRCGIWKEPKQKGFDVVSQQ